MNKLFNRYFSSVENSISRRLLRTVLSIYFVLTLVVTSAHIISEYYSAKDSVQNMLIASEKTFHDILAADMWNYNYDQLSITAESMMRLPFITGIDVTVSEQVEPIFSSTRLEETNDVQLFWHEFKLSYSEVETVYDIGKVRIYSDTSVVINQIKSGLFILIINAMIKTIALVLLVMIVFNRLLTRPLGKLARHAESIDIEDPEFTPIAVAENPKDELGQLQLAMNRMMGKTTDTIQKLDSLNKNLEKRVTDRTQKLSETVAQLDKKHNALKEAQVKIVASEKMASLGMLAAGVAHEINSPISFVMQNVNVLGEYNEAFHTLIKDYKAYAGIVLVDEDKAKELLAKIQDYEEEEDLEFIISDSLSLLKSTENGIVRVVDIVKNMKTFSHPDEESVHSVDVHEVLESTLLLMKNEIRANVRIVKELNANPFTIKCNRNQLGQIFLNLFMNALQAVPEGTDEIILIRTKNDEKNITIDIIDNGCGIAEDKIKLIFDPFYTSKEVGEGTGMGLSISYGIVKKHNGKIAVSSALGKGTKFSMLFPLEY